ncbi:Wwox [Symbiodinium natans]|uniref:Wwox protein n=1 Tax=Symbiodinium natans TaxID=878477 RepID=A0A812M5R9_9DINO|nr:Wwox [Symbiodinium natans]
MAVVTLRELIDRWEAGDPTASELMDRPWTQGLSSADDDEAADACAASLTPDVRRGCRLSRACSEQDARIWSSVLASLATPPDMNPTGADPRSMVPSLLQRMLIQTASDDIPLSQELDEACAAVLQRYSKFFAGVVRYGRLLDYGLPFDMAIAAAHSCATLDTGMAKEPHVHEQLCSVAGMPDVPGHDQQEARAGASDFKAFARLTSCIKRRAAKVSGTGDEAGGPGPASTRRTATEGFLPAIGDDAEADLGDGLVPVRLVLLEGDEVLLQGVACGHYAWMTLSSVFAPGASKASAQHRAVLGLGPEAGPREAGRAYRQLARQHHPDKGGDPEAFRRLRAAYKALSAMDPEIDAPVTPPRDVLAKHGGSLAGKKAFPVVLITGACNGIGLAVAEAMLEACPDCRLLVNGRSIERVDGMRAKLSADAQSRCQAALADLSSLREVDALSKELAQSPPDVIVCCAGIATLPRWTPTSDGYESQFAVNHLAHFHLAWSLAQSAAKPIRVVMVSSDLQRVGQKFLQLDLETINSKSHYSFIGNYLASKYCNVLFARSLHQRKVQAVSCTPGEVDTDIDRHLPWLLRVTFRAFRAFSRAQTPEQGAAAVAYCAAAPVTSGGFYARCVLTELQGPAMENQLWTFSEQLVAAALQQDADQRLHAS